MKKLILFLLLCPALTISAQDVQSIHRKAIVIDTHGDVMYQQIESGIDIGLLQQTGNFDLVRAKKGGLDAQIFSIWCDENGGYERANREIDSLFSLINRYPDRIMLVKNARDLQKSVAQNKLAAMIGVEGGHMIENSLNKLDQLANRGMIYLTLTWNNSVPWASSAADETSGKVAPKDAGLNEFGRQVVKRLNTLGVMVDLSHVGEKTFFDALKATSKPVIASHSCVYALNPVPRNLKDEQIKAIKKNKGLISVNFYSGFIDPQFNKKQADFLTAHAIELKNLSEKYGRSKAIDTLMTMYPVAADAIRPPLDMLIDHIDYIVNMIGVDYVGMGADFDGAESYPAGINGVADYPKVTAALIKRGYSARDIYKIMGGNFIRVLKANKGN